MELTKGLYKNISKSKIPQGHWNDARNIVVSQKDRNVTVEEGFNLLHTINGVLIGRIETNTKVILFIQDSTFGEIYLLNELNVLTLILRSDRLNFNIDNPIEGVFTYNNKREFIISWWDGLADSANPPRILNIDCLPFDVDVNKEPVNPDNIALLQLFPDLGSAEFELLEVANTGGNIFSGVYAFVYAYVLEDGTVSNFTGLSNWIPIVRAYDTETFIAFDGVKSDTFTGKSIKLKLKNLDTNFKRLQIGVVKKNGGIISTTTLETVDIYSTDYEFTYSGLQLEKDIDIVSLLTPTTAFKRVKTGVVLENRLHVANSKTQERFNFQPYANNIKVEWVREDNINLAKIENSYKDVMLLFDKKGFSTDSVYAPVIVFKLLDGTFSEAFHIPNVESRLIPGYAPFKSNDLISAINAVYPETRFTEALLVSATGRYHEFFNDALSTGEMGYWENQNELYPDEDCSDIKDNTGTVIDTLRNKKIRHHKFPAVHQLQTWGNPFYVPSTGTPITRVASTQASAWGVSATRRLSFGTATSVNPAYFTLVTTTDQFELVAVQDLVVNLTFKVNITNVVNPTYWRILTKKPGQSAFTVREVFLDNNLFTNANEFIDIKEKITVIAGETIFFTADVRDIIISYPVVTSSELAIDVDTTYESDGTSKVLGFKLTDIFIPQEIKDNISGFYVGYLKRTIDNITKFAQTRFTTVKAQAVYNFDVKLIEPPVSVNYVKPEIHYTAGNGNLLFNTNITSISNEIRAVNTFQYFPKDIVAFYNGLRIDTTKDKASILVFELVNNLSTGARTTGAVYQYKTDLYPRNNLQKVVIIPKVQNDITTPVLYGGDTTIGAIQFSSFAPEGFYRNLTWNITNGNVDIDIQESASTFGFRYEDLPVQDLYLPKSNFSETNEAYLYNLDYNSLNELIPIIIAKCFGDCNPLEPTNTFPFRIARSPVQSTEANIINWRKFRTNDYYEMPDKDKGEIWKIQAFNRTLLIYQKYAMFVATPKDLLRTDSVTAALGQGDIFDRKPDELIPDGKGYAGNQSQWASFICKYGAIHVDAQQGKVFLFDSTLKEISNQGMYHFFQDLRDKIEKIDNPFNSIGWTASFDAKYNRLLLTKHIVGGASITISYSFEHNAWICEHDYLPNAIFYTRDRLLSVENNLITGECKVFEHNIPTKFGKFYSDVIIYPSYIEPIFNLGDEANVALLWKTILWLTTVESADGNTIYYDETFTSLLAYNDNQCTGVINLEKEFTLSLIRENIRNVEYNWKFNELRDIVVDRNLPIINKNGTINTSNLNSAIQWYSKSKFISKFIAVRLVYNNIAQKRLSLEYVTITANKSIR